MKLAAGQQPVPLARPRLAPPKESSCCLMLETQKDAAAIGASALEWGLYKSKELQSKFSGKSQDGLLHCPKSKLTRPLLLLPGWTTTQQALDPLVGRLTSANSASQGPVTFVQNGRFFQDASATQPVGDQDAKKSKLFILCYPDRRAGTDQNIEQARAATRAITSIHDQKLDLIGYSLGGILARQLLSEAEVQDSPYGKVALVGSPNHGTHLAACARRIVERDIDWAMKLGGAKVSDLPALHDMTVGEPKQVQLDQALPHQLQACKGLINIGVDGVPTLGADLLMHPSGDGLATAQSVRLGQPAVDRLLDPRKSQQPDNLFHPVLMEAPAIYAELSEFFGWEKLEVPPQLVGHRGCKYAPENTLAAFAEAHSRGAKAVEFDVQCTADGELVLMHDDQLSRTTNGQGRLTDKTLAQLRQLDAGSWFSSEFKGEKIPTLDEALSFCQGKLYPFIEIKLGPRPPDFGDKLLALLTKHQLTEHCQVISFDHQVLQELKQRCPQLQVGALISEKPMADAVKAGLKTGALLGIAGAAALAASGSANWTGALASIAASTVAGTLIGRWNGRTALGQQMLEQKGKVDQVLPFCWGLDSHLIKDAKEAGLAVTPYSGPLSGGLKPLHEFFLSRGCQSVISDQLQTRKEPKS